MSKTVQSLLHIFLIWLPTETVGLSFVFINKVGVRLTFNSQQNTEISGTSFPVEFEIKDDQPQDVKGKVYNIKVCIILY